MEENLSGLFAGRHVEERFAELMVGRFTALTATLLSHNLGLDVLGGLRSHLLELLLLLDGGFDLVASAEDLLDLLIVKISLLLEFQQICFVVLDILFQFLHRLLGGIVGERVPSVL